MRYFLDTEFYEDGKTIDLISIGIVAEDGRELDVGIFRREKTQAEELAHLRTVANFATLLFTRGHAPKEHDGSGRKVTCLCRWCDLGRALALTGRETKRGF